MVDLNLPGIFAVMAPFLMVVGIVWVKSRARIEEKRIAAGMGPTDDGRLARQDSRIEALEDRMQVLERIITDRGLNVAAQIEALRDGAQIDELTRERVKESR
jgi:hypothetical protein